MNRQFLYQAAFAGILVGLAYLVFAVTQANLERLGVDSNFRFLFGRAGFEIGQSLIPFDANDTIARAFLVALINTLVLAFTAIAGASLLGLLIGAARLSPNWLLARLATAYVELFRNIPSLLQIFFWYFVVLRGLPGVADSLDFAGMLFLNNRGLFLPWPGHGLHFAFATAGAALSALLAVRGAAARGPAPLGHPLALTLIAGATFALAFALLSRAAGLDWEIPARTRFGYAGGLVIMPEFMALVVGLSMYNATYISEIVRSGLQAVPRGQSEAAAALGLNGVQAFRLIVFPQALRIMIPPLTTIYLNLFKSTSLAAAIAYPEVVSVFVGTVNNLVGQPVAIMAITLLVYVSISFAISLLLNLYERRLARAHGRY